MIGIGKVIIRILLREYKLFIIFLGVVFGIMLLYLKIENKYKNICIKIGVV